MKNNLISKNTYDFIIDTELWYQKLVAPYREQDCAMCGVNPLKLVQIAKELRRFNFLIRDDYRCGVCGQLWALEEDDLKQFRCCGEKPIRVKY